MELKAGEVIAIELQ